MASGMATSGALPALTSQFASRAATAAGGWNAVARWLTWSAFGVVLILAALAPITRTGDALEYYAMATALADLRPPALTPAELEAFTRWLRTQPADAGFAATGAMDQPWLLADGRQDFSHFWFYSLLAAPLVAVTDAVALHPGYAFFILNASLLGLALWMVQRAFSPIAGLLVLASPLIWFINKAQVEVFTVSLLAIAMARARQGRFLWAGLAAAIAATQNIPMLAAVACFWAAGIVSHLIQRQRPRVSWQAILLVAATLIVGALHPVYYVWRVGVLTPLHLNETIDVHLPSMETYLAALIDPDIGFLPWMPLYGVLATIGLVLIYLPGWLATQPSDRRGAAWPMLGTPARRAQLDSRAGQQDCGPAGHGRGKQRPYERGRQLSALCGVILGAWFLFVFAQTTNLNSGGTVHISRYALWLLPLGLPLLVTTTDWLQAKAPALLPVAALIAFVGYATLFQPAQAERYLTPSPQAAFATAWAPALYRPVPEVFYERRRQVDGGVRGSAATGDCHVILLHVDGGNRPCRLDPAEATAVDRLFAAGWRAAWITRPGPLGLGPGRVTGALTGP